ncbi:hypothetical protein NGRA_2694 [Nosema granulosis]|uniref:Peptidase A2 domain-containing protein n=1 Tax=Nosema granulosis TaxID=83296 RepID=A0A9P6KXY2_9MICR|nr:hypothetical protein NGRA_2694 [Nosema granulosis]
MGNPFFVTRIINGKVKPILLDTGADVSLIGVDDLENAKEELNKYEGIVRSASGESIKTMGQKRKAILVIGDQTIQFSPLAMNKCKYIIVGADVITKRPELLSELLKKMGAQKRVIKTINQVKGKSIKEVFSEIFKTDIGDLNLCTMGTHAIRTMKDAPFCKRNGRIPISQEAIIEEEIEKKLAFWDNKVEQVPLVQLGGHGGEAGWKMEDVYRLPKTKFNYHQG